MIIKREHTNRWWQLLVTLLSLVLALILSALLVAVAGASVSRAFEGLYLGAFGNWKAVMETLVKATPLILTGMAVTLAFSGNVMNIGAEGQLFSGAIIGYWVSTQVGGLHPVLQVALIIASGFIGGAVCGLIPGLLKGLLKVDETILTVMMNYVVTYILSYFLAGPWQEEGVYFYFTPQIADTAKYPLLFSNSRLHMGFITAILVTMVVYWLLKKSRLGYEIRAMGKNPVAARFKGIKVSRIIIITMMISGGIAGLAGIGEVIGLHYRLRMDISSGYGFTGIIVAMLGGLNPFTVVLAAIFMGALINGSNRLQIYTGLPVALIYAMQAIVLLCLLSFQALTKYRIQRVKNV